MRARRIASAIFWGLVAILIVAPLGLWSATALWFRLPAPDAVRTVAVGAAGLFALATIVALFSSVRWRALLIFALAFAVVLVWWSEIRPPLARTERYGRAA